MHFTVLNIARFISPSRTATNRATFFFFFSLEATAKIVHVRACIA